MSEGIVKSIIGEGAYLVELVKDIDVADQITRLDGLIAKYQDKIDEAGPNTAIYELRQREAQTKKAYFEVIRDEAPTEETCWLADYPDGDPISVGDHVGIIDLDREYSEHKNIYPAFAGEHVYTPAKDGSMKPVGLMNPAWAYWNAAVGPGLQKWRPRYRHGEIYDLDKTANTCSVNLEELIGYAMKDDTQIMYLNDVDNLIGVPIDYMDCHAEAFEDGNIALVKFENNNYGEAVVIGFKDNPQPCGGEIVSVRLGDFAILWDVNNGDFHVDYPDVQAWPDVETFLAGMTDKTIGYPYEYALRRRYYDYASSINAYGFITRPNPAFSTTPGWIMEFTRQGPFPGQEYLFGDYKSIWGTLLPAHSESYYYFGGVHKKYFPIGPNYSWSSAIHKAVCTGEISGACAYDDDEIYVCSGDIVGDCDWVYYGFNADGTPVDSVSYCVGGNYRGGYHYFGSKYSAKTLVQIVFVGHSDWQAVTPVSSSWTVAAHAGCCSYPWTIAEVETQEPMQQPKNEDFSGAVESLVQAFLDSKGVVMPEDFQTFEWYLCGGEWTSRVLDPIFEVKIYGR